MNPKKCFFLILFYLQRMPFNLPFVSAFTYYILLKIPKQFHVWIIGKKGYSCFFFGNFFKHSEHVISGPSIFFILSSSTDFTCQYLSLCSAFTLLRFWSASRSTNSVVVRNLLLTLLVSR